MHVKLLLYQSVDGCSGSVDSLPKILKLSFLMVWRWALKKCAVISFSLPINKMGPNCILKWKLKQDLSKRKYEIYDYWNMIKSLLLLIKFYVSIYLFIFMCGHVCAMACVLRSEHNLQEPVLSHHVGPRAWTQVVRLGSKLLYLLYLFSAFQCLIWK